MKGCACEFWINVILTMLGYIPGHIHAFYVLIKKREEEQLIGNQRQYGTIPPQYQN
ncbi:hypothetical protein BDB01DRAFT_849310 [Pilobolus umbonatus]|nr:hypothetical protein BDB01DRAFT_849310 [Pilobolus umbonatus]